MQGTCGDRSGRYPYIKFMSFNFISSLMKDKKFKDGSVFFLNYALVLSFSDRNNLVKMYPQWASQLGGYYCVLQALFANMDWTGEVVWGQ